MTKIKRFATALLACALMVSTFAMSASAYTDDREHQFNWSKDNRYSATPTVYLKRDNSETYLKTKEYTLPMGGYDVWATSAKWGDAQKQTTTRITIGNGNYNSYAFKHNVYAKGLYAGIKTYYPKSNYSGGGDVTVYWSEDYTGSGADVVIR